MSGYIEVMIKGDCRAFLEVGSVCGVITSKSMAANTMATPDQTISIIMRGGDTLEGVYGVSAMKVMYRIEGVKLLLKDRSQLCVVAFLDEIENFDQAVAYALDQREMVSG